MPSSSITQIQQLIDLANTSPDGLVKWIGSGQLKDIVTELNDSTKERGIMIYQSIPSMAASGFADAGLALVIGVGVYQWEPVGYGAGSVPAVDGGYWNLKLSATSSGFSFSFSDTILAGATGYDVAIPNAPLSTNTYKVQMTATNVDSGKLIYDGLFITNKTVNTFRLVFNGALGTTITPQFDFTISY